MQKILWSIMILCLPASAQNKRIAKNRFADSLAADWKQGIASELPVTSINENERIPTLPSPLHANRDVFMNMAGFHFSPVRYRFRGLDAGYFSTELNGIPMNTPEEGATPWYLWSGLTDVTRNTQSDIGLRSSEFSFGNIGSTTGIDTRASRQRVQTQFGYAFSNRSFSHRWSFTHSTGFNRQGWAFSFSASYRYAGEGYVPGTFYDGKSYFIAIDKKTGSKGALSFNLFGSALVSGKQGAITTEVRELLGTSYYNPYWGYQAGKKRNANVRSGHQPVMIIRYDLQPDNHTTWTSSVALILGQRSDSGLDWYKAADPRPDYYRYLPGYQSDSTLRNAVAASIKADKNTLQVNWTRLYETNRNSHEGILNANGVNGNTISGRRAHYIIEDRVTAARRFVINSVLQTLVSDNYSFTAGGSLQLQATHKYKKINDLLGGEFYVDWNQFAERDFPGDAATMQNDVRRPDRLLYRGDRFGYDYYIHTLSGKAWAQVTENGKRFDNFAAAEITYTNFKREGMVANGLFPRNSFGSSFLNEFSGYAIKAGTTYKINGRRYLYILGGYFLKPPLSDNVFISPKTHDARQENIRNERTVSAEAGYIWNAPVIKLRVSGYYLSFSNGMNIMTFYHDGYGNFVNYALSDINKIHYGLEAGVNLSFSEKFSVELAASPARYFYSSRQRVTVTADNDASVLERGIIYAKGYRVAGTPQESYAAGFNYQSSFFFCSITGSYFRQQWLEFNPLRRTPAAVEGIAEGTKLWKDIVDQVLLPQQYSIDVSAGSSVRIKLPGVPEKKILLLYTGISNLLNKKDIISGGYEQLRFDTDTKNIAKFPPKYFYAMGINFSINLTLRL